MAGKDRYACLFIEDRLRLFHGAAASAPLLGLDLKIGYIVGTTAMAGDRVASFVKSRLGLPASQSNGGSIRFPNRSFLCSPAGAHFV
jgi:hypothetical protein